MNNLSELKSKIDQLIGERNHIRSLIIEAKKNIKDLKRQAEVVERAQFIIKEISKKTQQQLIYHISELVSLALTSVFGDEAYGFKVNFEEKRGKTECSLVFLDDGDEVKPVDSSGFGPLDVASFALRVALWNIQRPKTRNVLILDEPFKHLRGEEFQKKAGELLSEISKKLNIQIIVISDVLFSIKADKTFSVVKKGKFSEIHEVSDTIKGCLIDG